MPSCVAAHTLRSAQCNLLSSKIGVSAWQHACADQEHSTESAVLCRLSHVQEHETIIRTDWIQHMPSPLNAYCNQAFYAGLHACSVAVPGWSDRCTGLAFTHDVSWKPSARYKDGCVPSNIDSSPHSFSHFDSPFFSHSFTLHRLKRIPFSCTFVDLEAYS